MAGASITVTKEVPQLGKSLIYFSATSDASGDLNFSDYKSVDYFDAVIASSLAKSAATAYTEAGDIRIADALTAVKGVALVNF